MPAEVFKTALYVLLAAYVVTALLTVFLIILENRSPEKTVSWTLVIILLPLAGFILYLFFGRNFRKQKMFSGKEFSDLLQIEALSEKQLLDLPKKRFSENTRMKDKLNLIKLLINNNKALLTEKNKLTILNNGREKFPSVIKALNAAKDHIHLEYYIIEDDKIGNCIKDILIEKAKNGVEVRVIYDDVGSRNLSKHYITSLVQSGVEIYPFMPVLFPRLTTKMNYRNHRKVIIVDGEVGFIGGMNIADRYLEGNEELGIWRDTQLKIEGAAVRSLQVVFLTDWHFASGKMIGDPKYFPETNIESIKPVQIASSGPDSDWASIMQVYFAAVAAAKEYIYIVTPYFMPNESVLTALKTAALGGADVRILLPSKSDVKVVYWGTKSYVEELLEAGIKVYFYKKGFVHSKLMVVDDIFCSIGTANMDLRSFHENFEINALVYDSEIATSLKSQFFKDLDYSEEVVLSSFSQRPLFEKFKESTARLFSPLL